jgi:hypothetical protein
VGKNKMRYDWMLLAVDAENIEIDANSGEPNYEQGVDEPLETYNGLNKTEAITEAQKWYAEHGVELTPDTAVFLEYCGLEMEDPEPKDEDNPNWNEDGFESDPNAAEGDIVWIWPQNSQWPASWARLGLETK